jgi:hypothetical protein
MKSIGSKLVLVAACSMFIFSNCKKSEDNSKPGVENYDPITAGSTWTYLNTPGGSMTLTATTKDTVALTRTYKVFNNPGGPNNYRTKVGGDYYRFGMFSDIVPGGIEENYLKDGKAVNDTWTTTQNITAPPPFGTVPATLTYTVKEKGISRTVSGKAYNNVVHIRVDIAALTFGLGGGDFWYANGIGLIEASIAVNPPGQAGITQTQVLTSYNIK